MISKIRVAPPLLFAFILAIASPVTPAQQPMSGARPDPAEASAPVPAAIYRSPFTAYRQYSEQEIAPWRESNDTAGSIGGWRAYLREAQQDPAIAKPPALPAVAPVAKPATKPMHRGPHHMHMRPPARSAAPEAPKAPKGSNDAHQNH